jgi:hypothetical protein
MSALLFISNSVRHVGGALCLRFRRAPSSVPLAPAPPEGLETFAHVLGPTFANHVGQFSSSGINRTAQPSAVPVSLPSSVKRAASSIGVQEVVPQHVTLQCWARRGNPSVELIRCHSLSPLYSSSRARSARRWSVPLWV